MLLGVERPWDRPGDARTRRRSLERILRIFSVWAQVGRAEHAHLDAGQQSVEPGLEPWCAKTAFAPFGSPHRDQVLDRRLVRDVVLAEERQLLLERGAHPGRPPAGESLDHSRATSCIAREAGHEALRRPARVRRRPCVAVGVVARRDPRSTAGARASGLSALMISPTRPSACRWRTR